MARTDTLGNFLTDVAKAIREKKGTSGTIQASDFDTEIANLPSGGDLDWNAIGYEDTPQSIVDGYNYAKEIYDNWDYNKSFNGDKKLLFMPLVNTSNKTNMSNMFSDCLSLITIPLLDTSNVILMSNMFQRCSSLTTIPLLDTNNVTNMSSMFSSCSSLTTIPLLNTSKVTNMSHMFNGCSSLTTIPLLNTSNVTNMQGMFSSCSSLTTIPLLDTSNVTNMQNMFNYCRKLTDEDLDNILQMCINATSYTGTKTLKTLGISDTTSRIEALQHYQDFINAGWTI